MATIEKPIVDPTIQWVPEMGNFRNEAMSCQTADPEKEKAILETHTGREPLSPMLALFFLGFIHYTATIKNMKH